MSCIFYHLIHLICLLNGTLHTWQEGNNGEQWHKKNQNDEAEEHVKRRPFWMVDREEGVSNSLSKSALLRTEGASHSQSKRRLSRAEERGVGRSGSHPALRDKPRRLKHWTRGIQNVCLPSSLTCILNFCFKFENNENTFKRWIY